MDDESQTALGKNAAAISTLSLAHAYQQSRIEFDLTTRFERVYHENERIKANREARENLIDQQRVREKEDARIVD